MRHFNAVSIVVVVLLLVASLSVLPAFALAAPATGEVVADDGNESGNESSGSDGGGSSLERLKAAVDSATAAVAGDGSGSGGGHSTTGTPRDGSGNIDDEDGGGGIFDVDDRLLSITDTLISMAREELRNLIALGVDVLNELLFQLPAPGDPGDPLSWYTPENGWWPDFMEFYAWMAGLAVGGLTIGAMLAMLRDDPAETKARLRVVGKAFFMVILGPLVIGAYLHFFNEVNMVVAPSGSEFVETPASAAKLGVGGVVVLLLLKFYALAIVAAVGMLLAQFILTFVSVGMWPVSWTLRAVPSPLYQSLGEFGTKAFYVLGPLNFFQVAILRMTFSLDWGAYGWAVAVVAIVGTGLMILVSVVGTPWYTFKYLLDSTGTSIGVREAKDTGSNAVDYAESRVDSVRARFNDSPRGSSSSEDYHRPQATSTRLSGSPSGSSSSSSSSPSRSRSAGSSSSGSSSNQGKGPLGDTSDLSQEEIRRRRRDIGL